MNIIFRGFSDDTEYNSSTTSRYKKSHIPIPISVDFIVFINLASAFFYLTSRSKIELLNNFIIGSNYLFTRRMSAVGSEVNFCAILDSPPWKYSHHRDIGISFCIHLFL